MVLRRRAAEVTLEELALPETQQLIDDMIETFSEVGVGLAAPQVGVSRRIVVIEDRKEYQRAAPAWLNVATHRSVVPLTVFVNPVLTVLDATPADFFEGCLSVDGYRAMVPRAFKVHVEALDRYGRPFGHDAVGWYARILQHEVDHLDGVLYVDRMASRTLVTTRSYSDEWLDETPEAVRAAFGVPQPGTG